ncbi:MAG TPA: hypothetical protein VIM71_02555 [Lacunisphaera sp.]
MITLLLAPAMLPAQVQTPAAGAAEPAKANQLTPAAVTTNDAASRRNPERETKKSDDVLVLNPFEVNATKDDGFMATNAGTATKLGIDLKDLAAPYSVMTGEFIKAMGIVDLREAALWTTNGAPVFDGGNPDGIGAPTMYFNRGAIINTGQQRNYFLNSGIGDTYNVERIDFGRGPNAVLFSVGSNNVLGGGISSQGKRARFDRNTDTVAVTIGSWDYYRGTIDVNRVLTDKFAVRANGVLQKRGGWMQNEFEDRTGITLTGSYRLAPRTELRIEGYNDRVKRTLPVVPYFDKLSGWNGSTVFDGRITDAMLSTTATPGATYGLTFNGEPQGIFRRTGNDYFYDPVSGTVMNWIHMGETRPGDDTNRTPIYFEGGTVAWSRQGNNEIPQIGNRNTSFYDTPNLPTDRFSRQVANSNFQVPSKRFSMMAKDPIMDQRTRDINLGFTHQFSDTLFFELHADFNRVNQDVIDAGSYGNLRFLKIDINRNLPNGQPNPHFKEAYGEMDMFKKNWKSDNAGLRAYLGYIKDLGKWGHYTFNLSLAGNRRVVDTQQRVRTMALAADPREWHAGSQRIRVRYYMNDDFRPFGDEVAPNSLFEVKPISGGNGGYTTSTISVQPRWVLNGWDYRDEQTKTGIFAFAARYFDNKLIISPGLRVDEQQSYFRERPTSWAFLPNDPNWDGLTLDDRYWRPDAPADWKTLTYIPKNADGTPRSKVPIPAWGNRPTLPGGVNDVNLANPVYANDRFRGDYNRPRYKKTVLKSTAGLTYHAFDWMSVKLSYGDNYTPADTGNMILTGEDAKPQTGIAYEAGLTFSLFKDNLTITPRYYFNRREYQLGDPPSKGEINNLMSVRAWNDSSPEGRNPFGYTDVFGKDYFSAKNTGYEVEIVGRITRGWRLSGSLGTAMNTDYDRWKNTRPYVLSRKDEFLDVLKAAGGTLDTSRKPENGSRKVDDAPGYAIADPAITDAMINAAGGDTRQRQKAIDNYNGIWVKYDTIATLQDTVGLKRISAKLVSDYTFQTGALKGLRVGVAANYVDSDKVGDRGGDTIINPDFDPSKPITNTNRQWKDDPTVDSNTPVWIKRPLEIRGMLGYSRRLRSGYELELQLNIINLLNHQEAFFRDRNTQLRPPGGDYTRPDRITTPAEIAYFQKPRSYEFTTTLRF